MTDPFAYDMPLNVEHWGETPPYGAKGSPLTPATGQALAECLQESDCIMVQRNTPQECLRSPNLEQLPIKCQQLKKGLSECKYGLFYRPPPTPSPTRYLIQANHMPDEEW